MGIFFAQRGKKKANFLDECQEIELMFRMRKKRAAILQTKGQAGYSTLLKLPARNSDIQDVINLYF